MKAKTFNQLYPPGTRFMHFEHPAMPSGRVVKTVSPARDFKRGCVVEINVEPYFVKVETLKAPH
ncbi:TPA: hypothetical protein H7D48_004984 [Escherichia coli]|nr:hypothetical protein [Escherichia coli]